MIRSFLITHYFRQFYISTAVPLQQLYYTRLSSVPCTVQIFSIVQILWLHNGLIQLCEGVTSALRWTADSECVDWGQRSPDIL